MKNFFPLQIIVPQEHISFSLFDLISHSSIIASIAITTATTHHIIVITTHHHIPHVHSSNATPAAATTSILSHYFTSLFYTIEVGSDLYNSYRLSTFLLAFLAAFFVTYLTK